jgi:negative regulator of flagellin synthesis FlgM
MNIQKDLYNHPPISGATQVSGIRPGADEVTSQSAEASQEARDQANLSTAARVANQALGLSDIRQEKISAVQGAIANGSYNVPSSQVAASLMQHLTMDQQKG